ncbi:alpha/beta hydrolase [Aliishimia ponticola]|uniref:Alpha/beta hydrolase n=1 Tax=Aliishimia ponticola TaxID=2499833 RepID=A0A4S4NF05_9RHOB|nr:alpha/beta hydrolase [Aliishimia ponticola]THH38134.1 alpha/beta hydrolase [Aliishimia ponticola]
MNIAVPIQAPKPAAGHIARVHDGTGMPVVFIPGFLETTDIWSSLLRRTRPFLPECHALSLPGHPPWVPEPDDHLTDDWANTIAETLEDLGPKGVRLVGHSTGGLVALEIARLRPDLVKDVLLIGALHAGDVGGHKTWTHAAAEMPWIGPFLLSAALKAWLRSEESFRAGLASSMADRAGLFDVPVDMREMMRSACPRTLHALLQWMSHRDGADLSDISAPVASVIGTRDAVISPHHQIDTLRLLGNSSATLVPTGHLPFLERPDLFDPLFLGWLSRRTPN